MGVNLNPKLQEELEGLLTHHIRLTNKGWAVVQRLKSLFIAPIPAKGLPPRIQLLLSLGLDSSWTGVYTLENDSEREAEMIAVLATAIDEGEVEEVLLEPE